MKPYVVIANGKVFGDFDDYQEAQKHAEKTSSDWKMDTFVFGLTDIFQRIPSNVKTVNVVVK